MSGCSSVVEHNLAKVGVEGSNPFARSSFSSEIDNTDSTLRRVLCRFRLSGRSIHRICALFKKV